METLFEALEDAVKKLKEMGGEEILLMLDPSANDEPQPAASSSSSDSSAAFLGTPGNASGKHHRLSSSMFSSSASSTSSSSSSSPCPCASSSSKPCGCSPTCSSCSCSSANKRSTSPGYASSNVSERGAKAFSRAASAASCSSHLPDGGEQRSSSSSSSSWAGGSAQSARGEYEDGSRERSGNDEAGNSSTAHGGAIISTSCPSSRDEVSSQSSSLSSGGSTSSVSVSTAHSKKDSELSSYHENVKTLKRSNKEFRSNLAYFQQQMTAFVESLASIEVVFQNAQGQLNIAEVFHHRLLSTLQVTPSSRANDFLCAFRLYLLLCRDELQSSAQRRRLERAQRLCDYLRTHIQDPDCGLIGLSPSDQVLKYTRETLTALNTAEAALWFEFPVAVATQKSNLAFADVDANQESTADDALDSQSESDQQQQQQQQPVPSLLSGPTTKHLADMRSVSLPEMTSCSSSIDESSLKRSATTGGLLHQQQLQKQKQFSSTPHSVDMIRKRPIVLNNLKIDPAPVHSIFKMVELFPHRVNVVDTLLAWDDQLQTARLEQMLDQMQTVGSLLRACEKHSTLWEKVQLSPGDVLIAYVYADQHRELTLALRKRRIQQERKDQKRYRRRKTLISKLESESRGQESEGKVSPEPAIPTLPEGRTPSEELLAQVDEGVILERTSRGISISDYLQRENSDSQLEEALLQVEQEDEPLTKYQDTIIYCRYIKTQGDKLLVFPSYEEQCALQLDWRQVLPMTAEHKQMMGHVRTMSQLVVNPINHLYQVLSDYVREETFRFLREQGVDPVVLERSLSNKITIMELFSLKDIRKKLDQLFTEKPPEFQEFVATIHKYTTEERDRFLNELTPTDVFAPDRRDALREICTVDFGEIAAKRIQRYVGFCDSALGQLRLDKRDLLSGIQKQAMTEWWLELIESRVDEFLKSVGYHFGAVPDDYIGSPPNNIDHVEENLRLVSEILDPSKDIHQVKAFIEELKNLIYPRIDEFLANGKVALSEQFQISVDDFSIAEVQKRFEAQKSEYSEQVVQWIDGMIKDMDYLFQIKKAENAPKGGGGGLELGPVPITGLILSCFFRLQNELQTVMELWANVMRKKLPGAATSQKKSVSIAQQDLTCTPPAATPAATPVTPLPEADSYQVSSVPALSRIDRRIKDLLGLNVHDRDSLKAGITLCASTVFMAEALRDKVLDLSVSAITLESVDERLTLLDRVESFLSAQSLEVGDLTSPMGSPRSPDSTSPLLTGELASLPQAEQSGALTRLSETSSGPDASDPECVTPSGSSGTVSSHSSSAPTSSATSATSASSSSSSASSSVPLSSSSTLSASSSSSSAVGTSSTCSTHPTDLPSTTVSPSSLPSTTASSSSSSSSSSSASSECQQLTVSPSKTDTSAERTHRGRSPPQYTMPSESSVDASASTVSHRNENEEKATFSADGDGDGDGAATVSAATVSAATDADGKRLPSAAFNRVLQHVFEFSDDEGVANVTVSIVGAPDRTTKQRSHEEAQPPRADELSVATATAAATAEEEKGAELTVSAEADRSMSESTALDADSSSSAAATAAESSAAAADGTETTVSVLSGEEAPTAGEHVPECEPADEQSDHAGGELEQTSVESTACAVAKLTDGVRISGQRRLMIGSARSRQSTDGFT